MKLQSIDIHNHLLPGVDDGFGSESDSLEAVRIMREAGVREFVFTPHINPDLYPDGNEEKMRAAYERFLPLLPSGVKASLAAEYMVCSDFGKRVADHPQSLLCFPDRSVLVEMSYYFRSVNLEESLFELQMAGFRPILAHPERYLYMADRPEDFDALHENGCRFQLNCISFTGAYGPASVRIIRYLARRGYIDFVATDLHSLRQLENILSGRTAFFLRPPFTRYTGPSGN